MNVDIGINECKDLSIRGLYDIFPFFSFFVIKTLFGRNKRKGMNFLQLVFINAVNCTFKEAVTYLLVQYIDTFIIYIDTYILNIFSFNI